MPTRRIGYRRFSGDIPLSSVEPGGTGLWLEKRWALLAALRQMGFEVVFLNHPTKFSKYELTKGDWRTCDVILIEFAPDSRMLYREEVEETCAIIGSSKPTVYLLDDPDVFTTVTRACNRFWVNAKNIEKCRLRFTGNAQYMPFAALQTGHISIPSKNKGIYWLPRRGPRR